MEQNNFLVGFLVCLVNVLLSAPTMGQLDGSDRLPSPAWRRGIPIHLVLIKEVQVEISLDEESIKKIKVLCGDKDIGRRQAPDEEQIQKTLDAILSLEQIERLHQIHVQQMGMHAILDANVAKAIGLNDDELSQVRMAQKIYFRDSVANVKKRDNALLSKIEATRGKVWNSIMTDDRKLALEKLGGKKVLLRSPSP